MVNFRNVRSLALLVGVTTVLLTSIVLGTIYGLGTAILVLAAGALLGCVALLWASVQGLTDEAPMTLEEALSLAAPSAEEERKRAVLRALKDLEYERSVGKVSEADYHVLSLRYREEAKDLLRAIDAQRGDEGERVEQLIEQRLKARTNKKKRSKAQQEPAPSAAAGAAQRTDDERSGPVSDGPTNHQDTEDAASIPTAADSAASTATKPVAPDSKRAAGSEIDAEAVPPEER